MTWTIVKIIIGVLVLAGFSTWTVAWLTESSMSENPKVRRRAQVADSVITLAMATIYALASSSGREKKLWLLVSGLIIAMWALRALRFLLRRAKAPS